MRRLVYYVGASVDGRIAGPADEVDLFAPSPQLLDWIVAEYPETLPHAYREAVGIADVPNRRFDTVVMGLGTYRPALDAGITRPYPHLREVVVSTSLADPDPGIEVVRADVLDHVRALKAEPGADIWLCGGGRLAGALLPEIDEVVLKRYPVLAGAGRPMLDGAFAPTALRTTGTTSFDDGTLVSVLERA